MPPGAASRRRGGATSSAVRAFTGREPTKPCSDVRADPACVGYSSLQRPAAPGHCKSMQRIVVLNPKGGSGKTTIAINLASYFASRGQRPVLMDHDPQGSSVRWVRKRDNATPRVHSSRPTSGTCARRALSSCARPTAPTRVIVDTPAAVDARRHAGTDAQRRQDPGAGTALGHRHPRLLALHPESAAGGQDAPRRQPARHHRQPGASQHTDLSVAQRFLETLGIPIVASCAIRRTTCAPRSWASGLHEMKPPPGGRGPRAMATAAGLAGTASPPERAGPDRGAADRGRCGAWWWHAGRACRSVAAGADGLDRAGSARRRIRTSSSSSSCQSLRIFSAQIL